MQKQFPASCYNEEKGTGTWPELNESVERVDIAFLCLLFTFLQKFLFLDTQTVDRSVTPGAVGSEKTLTSENATD